MGVQELAWARDSPTQALDVNSSYAASVASDRETTLSASMVDQTEVLRGGWLAYHEDAPLHAVLVPSHGQC